MKFKAFAYSIDANQYTTIRKMIQFLTEEEPEIIDLRSFEPEISKDDLVLVYGIKAQRRLEKNKCLLKVEFPEPYKLGKTALGNETDRKSAWEKLIQLKNTLDSGNMEAISKASFENQKTLNLTEELPSKLTATNIKELERQQKEQGKTHWSGWTTNGKSIRVTVEPEKSEADINITFAELYAVMGLKEVFRVKELEIVCKSSHITETNNTKKDN
jgi:hypothetical protein